MTDLKKRNENLLENRQNIVYVKAADNVIIRKVDNEQITPVLFEFIKKGGQEVICLEGATEFTLSYYHTSSIPQVIKVHTKIREEKVSFNLDAQKTYLIDYSKDDGFYVETPEKIKWTTSLYKNFKNKFGL